MERAGLRRKALIRLVFPRIAFGKCAVILTALILGACASVPPETLHRPTSVWETEFEYPVSYHTLVGDDLLVAGTARHLYGLNPKTGAQLWRLRNINTNEWDVLSLKNEPFILINDAAGGAFDDAATYMLAVDRLTGRLHWESPVFNGRVLQSLVDFDNRRAFGVVVEQSHGDDSGFLSEVLPNKGLMSGFKGEPIIIAIDLSDGSLLWQREIGDKVLMRPSYRPGVSDGRDAVRPFDLGLYHGPSLSHEQICVTYVGVQCYRVSDGEPIWSNRFKVIDDHLGLSYPKPVVDEALMAVGKNDRVEALDPRNGRRKWRSDKLGRIPEFLDDEIMMYAQIGGRYFDIDKEEWVARGKFGAAAINKRNGNVLWHYDDVRGSISNLLVAGPFVWFADEERLFAIDRLDGSTGFRRPHGLRQSPTFVALNQEQQIVLVSESEVAGYERETADQLWYHDYPAPGSGPWRRFAAGLLSASGAIFKLSSTIIAYGSGMLPSIPNITVGGGTKIMSGKSFLEDSTGYLGEKLSEKGEKIGDYTGFANLSGDTQYFVTKLKGYKDVVLAAVDVNTGETRELTVLPSKTANLVIDEINGHAYQVAGNRLLAVPLGR